MDNTIAGSNISSYNVDSLTIVDNLDSSFFSFDKAYSFSSKGLNISSGNISSHDSGSSNNMSSNNGFGLFRGEALKSTFWKFGKSFIRWRKNGDSFNSLQGFNKSKIADNFDQSGESTSSNSNIHNISNFSSRGLWCFLHCRSFRHSFSSRSLRNRFWCSNNNIVNDMDNTIAGSNISSYNVDSLTIVDNLDSSFFSFDKAYSFSSKGLNISSGNISSHDSGSSNNMSGNNGFGLFRGEAFKSTFWKFGKSFIGRSENGDSFNSLQGFNKTKIAYNFDQSGESTSSDGNINNITNFSNFGNRFFNRCRFSSRLRCSNNDIINDMNDTIAGTNISSDNIDGLTIIDYLNSTFFSFDKAYSFSSKSLNISSGNISSIN